MAAEELNLNYGIDDPDICEGPSSLMVVFTGDPSKLTMVSSPGTSILLVSIIDPSSSMVW